MGSRRLAVGRALLVAAAGGAALTWLGLILLTLAVEGRVQWILQDGLSFGAGGAAAGCLAVGLLWIERRWFASRIPAWIAGLVTYYICVIACWSVTLAIEGGPRPAQHGGGFSDWLNELMASTPAILAIATWPFGLITIPLCFLLRWWVGRILAPALDPPARMDA